MMRTSFAVGSHAPGPRRAGTGRGGRATRRRSVASAASMKKANEVRDLQVTDAEEQQLGAAVSEQIRTRYGVVQDAAVHRYVALVGTALAQASTRPALPWTFIVLDTDGVNAFAAPGGFVHITRGALALIQNEAELAGVLGHEIIHVTEKHTIKSIQKSKAVQMGAPRRCPATPRSSSAPSPPPTTTSSRRGSAARKRTSRTRRASRWPTGRLRAGRARRRSSRG